MILTIHHMGSVQTEPHTEPKRSESRQHNNIAFTGEWTEKQHPLHLLRRVQLPKLQDDTYKLSEFGSLAERL